VESVYLYGAQKGFEVVAAINGYNGLVDEDFVTLNAENATGISGRGGCVFKCGRCQRIYEKKYFDMAVKNIKKHKFDGVVVLGGNGSAIGAGRFKAAGVNVILVPSTIDNDVDFTKHSLGFSSACETGVKMVDMIKNTMETSQRDHIILLMGRHCNELANRIGLASFADIIDMEGDRHTPETVAAIFAANRKKGKTSSFMIMQEKKSADHVSEMADSAKFVEQVWAASANKEVRLNTLGYLQRGAEPSCYDRFLAVMYGRTSVDCIIRKKFGVGLSATDGVVSLIELPLAPLPI
jgi:6-phosphofructokinase 1